MSDNRRILLVDDDPNVLSAYKRSLYGRFQVTTALGPEEGLRQATRGEPFAVVVSDYAMPGMNGVELLARLRQEAPDTVRMMLTGYADLDNAMRAINDGNIFRFLGKPCDPERLSQALEAGVEQYRLIRSEKELLEQTLLGSVRVMSQMLSLVNPTAFSNTSRIKFYMKQMATELNLPNLWQFELAAMLSQLGCITLPPETLAKVLSGEALDTEESALYAEHPRVAANLLEKIPRMHRIAEMIARQQISFSDARISGERLPENLSLLGGMMLKAALDFDVLLGRGRSIGEAIRAMRAREGLYHPLLVQTLAKVEQIKREMEIRLLQVREIYPTMIADQEIHAKGGMLLLANGQEVTEPILERLISFSRSIGIEEPIRMRVPHING